MEARMALMKPTYVLSQDTLSHFEEIALPGKRSATIGGLLPERLDRRRRELLQEDIIAGCEAMADIYLT